MGLKHRSKEERQAQIIEGALACFFEKGFKNTSIDDIAVRCDLSKGTIYWYFTSKDDIVISTIRSFAVDFKEQFIFLSDKNPPSLKDSIDQLVDFFENNKGMFNLYLEYWAQSNNREKAKQYWVEVLMVYKEIISTIIHNEIARNNIKDSAVDSLVWSIMATLDGLGIYSMLVDSLDFRKMADIFIEILLNGLKHKM